MSPRMIEVQLDSDVGRYTMQVIEGDYLALLSIWG